MKAEIQALEALMKEVKANNEALDTARNNREYDAALASNREAALDMLKMLRYMAENVAGIYNLNTKADDPMYMEATVAYAFTSAK